MSNPELFGASADLTAEIDAALAAPNCSVDVLLKCGGLLSLFRAGHAGLVGFLKSESSMRRLLELIHTSNDRRTQATLLSLFQTSNTVLHRALAESITLTDFALSVLDDKSDSSRFGLGVISRILAKVFELWPDDMYEIFRLSTVLYPKIVANIDLLCVFHCAQTLVSALHGDAWLFVWRCWLIIAGPSYRLETKYVPPRPPIDRQVLTPRHIAHILELTRLFFVTRSDDEDREFAECVLRWVRETELTVPVIRLACALDRDTVVAQRVVKILSSCLDFDSDVFAVAVEYLVGCPDECLCSLLCDLLRAALSNTPMTVFGRAAVRSLLQAKAENECECVQRIIAQAFMSVKRDPLLCPFVLACAHVITGNERIEGWDRFKEEVVNRFAQDQEWNEEFEFINV